MKALTTTLESVLELSSCMSCVRYLHCMNKLRMTGIYEVFYIAESIIHVHATLLNFNILSYVCKLCIMCFLSSCRVLLDLEKKLAVTSRLPNVWLDFLFAVSNEKTE